MQQVYARFGGRDDFFVDGRATSLLEREPNLAALNAAVEHKSAFDCRRSSALTRSALQKLIDQWSNGQTYQDMIYDSNSPARYRLRGCIEKQVAQKLKTTNPV